MRSLGLLPMASSMGVLPLKVSWVFLTVAALPHQLGRCDLRQSGLVQFFRICIHECREKLLEQSYTHLELDLAKVCAVQLEVSSHCAFV